MTYVIYSQSETESDGIASYWSNEFGWVDLASATAFSEAERNLYANWLPLPDGEFVELPQVKEK